VQLRDLSLCMPSPPPTYYENLKSRAGDVLSDEQIKECEELGILVDRDDQGTLLQIFTKPVGDRYFQNFFDRVNLLLLYRMDSFEFIYFILLSFL